MVKRLCSLGIALAIAGAPAALEACQIVCASMSSHAASTRGRHQPHHLQPTAGHSACHEQAGARQQLSAQKSVCGHNDDAAGSRVVVARPSDAIQLPVAAVPPRSDVVLLEGTLVVRSNRSALPDRLEIRLAVPLRI